MASRPGQGSGGRWPAGTAGDAAPLSFTVQRLLCFPEAVWLVFVFCWVFLFAKMQGASGRGALGLLLLCGSWWGRAVGAARPTAQLAAGQPLPESPAPSPRLLPAPSRTWERVCAVGGVAVRETWRSSWIPTSPYSLPSLWGSEVLGLRDPGVRGRPWLVEGRGVCALGL